MNQMRLLRQLDRVASRYRQLRLWQLLALVWLGAALVGVVFWALRLSQAYPLPLLGGLAVLGALSALFSAIRYARDPAWIAKRVESTFPELQTCLLAAIELEPDLPGGRHGYLQGRVILQALAHAKTHHWASIVSPSQLWLAATANVLCFTLFAATVLLLVFMPPFQMLHASPLASSPAAMGETTMTIEPGDTEVELGNSLLVLARVQGPLPPEATLVFQTATGEETQLPMSVSLNDPIFSGRIPVVDQSLQYWVAMADQTSLKYRATVFEYPRLDRADAKLDYPEYTKLENRVVQDVRTVSVVEGTSLTLQCFLNKEVISAQLFDAKSATVPPIELIASKEEPLRYEATWTCDQSRRLKLALVDEAGRTNQKQVLFSINVTPNQLPSLKVVFPAKDLEVSPLEELELKASVWDDFGATKLGLTYSLAGNEPVDVVIAEQTAAKQKHEAAHVVRLEELSAETDQLLSYHWWAEDVGPDGQPRRVFGDMYFAEVRPFEEIFRQGEQPAGGEQQQRQQQQNQQGQGQNAQDAQQLAKLQKDIINATWKLVRRETGDSLTKAFPSDAEQVQLSQEGALEQATSLAERVQDPQSLQHIDAVLKHMQAAAEQLKTAAKTPSREPLQPALAAEQQAYAALLKLRAREHEVVQQQQRGQQSGAQQQSSARSQQQRQQLQQLEMRNEENRYETERAAQERKQESAEDRENRQIQNRLRELARRQSDVNERVKELQSALEEAQTEQQKEELRRQLKRLQDEQQQILQDTDELQSRLEQPQNAERMSEERQQLEETRDQVRRASEALEQERVGQASAAGSRAEQQFEDLREEFRRRAANRFNQEMQEMRQQARELEQNEQKIAEQLNPQPAQPEDAPPKLRDETPNREPLAEELGQQRQRLDDLQERMRRTIGEAEESEPILSQRLYEAVRDAQDRQIQQSMQQAERAIRQGLTEQAQQQEAAAGEGVRRLRESVERAAEGVLGDETEGLRRAREELRDLSRDLNEEIRRNGGESTQNEDATQRENAQGPPGSQSAQGNQREENQKQSGQGERDPDKNDPAKNDPAKNDRNQPGQGQNQQGERDEQEPQQEQGNEPGNPSGGGQQRPGQQQEDTGTQPSRENQLGNQEPTQRGEQPGQQQGPGQPMPTRGQRAQGETPQGQTQGAGGQRDEEQQKSQGSGGRRPNGERPPRENPPRLDTEESSEQGGTTGGGGNQRMTAPLTGEDFREWSARLRDVEEMIEDPELRAEVARIRERARAIRAELKRHSAEPNWDLVQQQVAGPLYELRNRVAEELLRRTSKKALVPLDRDPVPPQYSEKTRRYYEQLGTGK
jgi:hypothetical protein